MGVAHAGAYGDDQATVSALRLRPTQLRIASLIARSPDGAVPQAERGPELAEVVDGRVVIGTFYDEQSPVRGGLSWVK